MNVNMSKQLSTREKRKFYLQELLDDYKFLNKYLFGIVFFVFGGYFVRDRVSESQVEPLVDQQRQIIFVILSLLGVCLITLTSFKVFERITRKKVRIRLIVIAIGNLLIGAGIVWNIFYSITGFLGLHDHETWLNLLYLMVDGHIAVILNDIINPIWYMKIILPFSYCVGIVLAALNAGTVQEAGVILFFIFGLINWILLSLFKENFRWKLFLKKIEEERWNEIQKVILNKLPNLIVVVNSNSQMIYNNSEFHKVSNGENLEAFFKKIKYIKKGMGSEKSCLLNLNNEQIHIKQNNEDLSHHSLLSDFKSLKNTFLTLDKDPIDDLWKLLEEAVKSLKKGSLSDKTHLTFYGKLYEKDSNQNRSFEIILTPMVEHQNITFILNDTTQRDLIVALENNNLYKDKLLASVSHELRTPLNANLIFIDAALKSDEIPEGIKEGMLIPAYRSGKLLNFIVNDILDYCQLGVNKLRLAWKVHSIQDTIKSCYQLLELQVKAKGIEFNLDIDSNLPSLFKTDHDRVGQVILNLLSNALKFTFKGHISLQAKLVSQKLLEITVKDTGIGIKEEDQKKIFQEFVSLNEGHGYTKNSKGVGLGLTISDSLVRMLNPSLKQGIKLKSTYQEGSSFSFVIEDFDVSISHPSLTSSPIQKKATLRDFEKLESCLLTYEEVESPICSPMESPDQRSKTENFTASKSRLSVKNNLQDFFIKQKKKGSSESSISLIKIEKKRILIVDDEPFNIWALRALFKQFDVDIDSAYNGEEAIKKIIQEEEDNSKAIKYSVILMDCQMPIMDGYETTKILCNMMQEKKIKETPIIGCTALSDQSSLEACYNSGMRDILNKPISSLKIAEIWRKYSSE